MIIFGSVRFLSKKVTKPKCFFFKKTETESKPGQTDWFRFSSVWFFRAKTGSNRFGSVFSGFGLVFPVWLGFARFFSGFFSVSVRFGFFGFLLIKPNRTGRLFQNFNRFNRVFFSIRFFRLFFFGLFAFSVFLLTPSSNQYLPFNFYFYEIIYEIIIF